MDIVDKKYPLLDSGDHRLEVLAKRAVFKRRFDPYLDPRLVLTRLKPPYRPEPHIRQTPVVQVDRILGGEKDSKAISARLLQERDQRLLRGRVSRGWKVAEDFVHVEE